jgi:molybdenum cofactor cytidylyltransferase
MRVAPLRRRSAALIMSRSPGMAEKLLDDTATVTRQRLSTLGSHIDRELRCAHSLGALRDAIVDMQAAGSELILISGASVAKDRNDVVPAALVAAGGRIDHFGMPVEPGNMLLLGRIGEAPVICLPGCARSVRRNGVDWVLRRLLADLPVAGRDIMSMGVGGLIRSPAEEEEKQTASAQAYGRQAPPRLVALVLAAGQSRRMGVQNKLLCELEGRPLLCRAVDAALASRCCQVMVVTGWQAEHIEAALGDRPVSLVHNAEFATGMAGSLRCGLAALPADIDGAVILLADMPWIDAEDIDRLIAGFDPAAPAILVPEFNGQRGNPVVWPRRYFAEMRQIAGDVGARALLERHAEAVRPVAFESDAIFADVDTPAALAQLGSGPEPRAAA